jgi:hypothetical protein
MYLEQFITRVVAVLLVTLLAPTKRAVLVAV